MTTRYVCQFNSKKKGGFDCKASYRTKRFKHDGSVTVEKSSAEHDDKPRGNKDERTYDVYSKAVDQKIKECIELRMKFFQIKSVLKKVRTIYHIYTLTDKFEVNRYQKVLIFFCQYFAILQAFSNFYDW